MMILLSQRLGDLPLAVGLINEPTFVGKSRVVHAHLRHLGELELGLTFLIGTDTLTRFFHARYYPDDMRESLRGFFAEPPEGEGSCIVSARRGGDAESRKVEEAVLVRDEAKEWVGRGRVRMLESGEEEWAGISSTMVRDAVKRGDGEAMKRLVTDEVGEYIVKEGLYK